MLQFVTKQELTNHSKGIGDAGDDKVSYSQIDQKHGPGVLEGSVDCHSSQNTQVTQSTEYT